MSNKNNKMPPIELLKIGINSIKEMMDKEKKWQPMIDEMYDGHPISIVYDKPISAITKMLEILFNDKDCDGYGSQLSWWMFEADFGENESFANSVTDKDGNNIPMRTVEDLYNYYKKYTFNIEQ